eukprot:130366_1
MQTPESIEYVVMGFLRETEKKCDVIIPKSLKLLALLFYPIIIKYKGQFLSSNAGNGIKIVNEHQFTGYRSAKLNNPLPVCIYSDMITNIKYTWKAKVSGNDKGFQNAYIFGVVSNCCKYFGEYPYGDLKDSYGISLVEGQVFANGKKRDENYKNVVQLEEIVVIEYELSKKNEAKLHFYKQPNENDETNLVPIYSMDLPKDESISQWFPVFSKPGYMNSYIIVL